MSIYAPAVPHVHARAEHCSKPIVDQGQQIVRFQGASYLMVGIYFARPQAFNADQNGHRELYYILRPVSRDGDTVLVG